jgi:protease-4
MRRAKVLAGLEEDAKVRLVGYPGSSVWDLLRPRPSSQPAAASIPDALGGLITQSVMGIIEQAERSLTGANVLWVGESRF